MSDATFETRLSRELRTYAEEGVRPVDAHAIALDLTGRQRASRARPFVGALPRALGSTRWLAIAALLAVALVAGLVLVQIGRNGPIALVLSPSPAATPTASATAPATPAPTIRPSLVPADVRNGPIVVFAGVGFYQTSVGGTPVHLPIDHVSDRGCPTFSPNGRLLAFTTDGGDTAGADTLSISDPDGTNVRVLWTGTMNDQTFHQIVWAWDGSTVAATEAVGPGPLRAMVFGHPDGTMVVRNWGGGEFPSEIALSPDGTQLARASQDGLKVSDVVSGASLPIAPGAVRAVAWSPDGTTIAYLRNGGSQAQADLHFVDPEGHADVVVRSGLDVGGVRLLAWSAQGLLAVDTTASNGHSILIVDAAQTVVQTIGPLQLGGNLSFTWAPDGRALLFTSGADDRPLLVGLDGTQEAIPVPTEYYAQCPLAWGREQK